jgi:cation diffusion facilitator CzcD-associated flavoprotein CzcO
VVKHNTDPRELPQENDAYDIVTDALVVGGGMGGIYATWRFRQLGLSVKILEAGSYFGGTWHWNKYPGARVDTETPFYGLSIPAVYRTWTYSERFPGHEEIRRYFAHVDKTLDMAKDAFFNTIVTECRFDTTSGTWTVETKDGRRARCKYLMLAVGSSYKKHIPYFKGIETYKGTLIHSAAWPEDTDLTGKKIAVIGSGATGVQLVQTIAKQDCQLHAFVRTPNMALPMVQREMSAAEQVQASCFYESMYKAAKQCRSGYPYDPAGCSIWDVSPEERERYFEDVWNRGGFAFLNSNYMDFLVDKKANRLHYDFWAKKTRPRIKNPVKREILAPLEPPHWFATKRPCLEQDYYEAIDQDNVTVVDLKATPIEAFTEKGIQFSDRHEDYDIVIYATGYDSLTGSTLDMGLYDTNGRSLKDKWSKGTSTYLGLMISGMPHMFMCYSPQAPTSLSNGPPIIEIQIDWAVAAIKKMREEGVKYIDAQESASKAWGQIVQDISDQTLFPETDSWYMGANIPGKKREQLIYLGGVDAYTVAITKALEEWSGFDKVKE